MLRHNIRQPGQALVIIVFGMVALIGMAGLAIDGSSVYSDRRHAQNAADTSVMAAGLTKIRNPADWSIAEAAGYSRAAENGYDDNGVNNDVQVWQCTDVGANCTLPPSEPYTDFNSNGQWDASEPYTDTNGNGFRDAFTSEQFLQVTIDSSVPTSFARILGVTELDNSVEALARAIPPYPTDWYNGMALVALMPGCKPDDWPNDPFVVHGTSNTLINGSGVFVNSTCESPPAFDQQGSPDMTVSSGGICVVGGASPTDPGINPPPDDHCGTPIDLQTYQMPAIDNNTCTGYGVISDLGGANYVATPGRYDNNFPDVTPSGVLKLTSGVYCLQNGLSLSSNWVITTDIDGNGTFDGSDGANEGVLFYVHQGGVTFNGGSHSTIGAMNNPTAHPAARGYLFYLPPTNNETVTLTGNNGSHFIGTILAPASLVKIEGSSDTDSLTFEIQVIGFSVKVGGSGNLNITYYGSKTGDGMTSPIIQLYR